MEDAASRLVGAAARRDLEQSWNCARRREDRRRESRVASNNATRVSVVKFGLATIAFR